MWLPSFRNPSAAIWFFLRKILFVGGPFDVFDDLLTRFFEYFSSLSHPPSLSGDDGPEIISYSIMIFRHLSPYAKHALYK